MSVPTELTALHRTVEDLRGSVAFLRTRYGDIPAVRRLVGDVERLELDLSELHTLTPMPGPAQPEFGPVQLDDRPLDPALWADADDEGLGGYHREPTR
jgi:hypothetical protein